ncbi:capsule assembly Wzi family protein [Algoriphagus lacus]|uniref:capsule assembly Wzi family protein n=1 Tax=Algoriphagus lacus TaxID=2056311 RepID=UPI001F1E9872|nr:capsule assembly Wzi family protein [Algoriphagus lacus]
MKPSLSDPQQYGFTQYIQVPVDSLKIGILPLLNTTRITTKRPYGWGDYGLIPNPGLQAYFSGGIQASYKFINFTFRPELVVAQNKGFETNLNEMSPGQIRSKFFFWNYGDFPERFGNGIYADLGWGQSKLTFQYGAFELGGSTQNIWWGPGQFNALTFSSNAEGFPHFTLNTTKPARTFLGNFETQLIVGRLQNSGLDPSQDQELNEVYFVPFSGDWRYLNALMVSYNPKWIPGLFLGFTRTFHQYSESMESGFLAYFPVFEPVTKSNYGFDRDGNGQSQQISIFGRWLFPKVQNEIYFEYGRRDHSVNWREFALNPEHARAYILGFIQLFDLPLNNKKIQVRGELTHQQESVNRYIRYSGLTGGLTWHTHTPARGFVQNGQPLGVGLGVGSNVQTLEVARVDGISKVGIFFERLANNQDFYYKALLQNTERKPWIDLSLGFLYDKQWNNLLLSSKLQLIHARNYQWQLDPASTPEFPKGENLTSMMGQVSLVYFWEKK